MQQVEDGRWTQDHELLATIAELTHALMTVTIKANSKGNPHIEPFRIPRPGDDERSSEPSDAMSHLDALSSMAGGERG